MNKVATTTWAMRSVLGALLLFLLAAPADLMAQALRVQQASPTCTGEQITFDNGVTTCASTLEVAAVEAAAKNPAGSGSLSTTAAGSLTTLFASNNGFAGNTFDMEVTKPLIITGFDVNLDNPGSTNTATIYYRLGTSVGNENDPAAWTLLGSDAGVVSAGIDQPSFVDVGGLMVMPGQVYGFYFDLTTYPSAVVNYTNGGPNVYSNADMSLTTNTGQASPAFSGSFFPRQWNGTVYYDEADADLSLEKECEADFENKTATFYIEVTNNGPGDATGVEVQDWLPNAILVTDSDVSQGLFDPFTGFWDVGDLASGDDAELWIHVDLLAQGRYENHAEATANENDSNPGNNADACAFIILGDRVVPDFVPGGSAGGVVNRGERFSADLAVTKMVDVETAVTDDEVTFTVMVENLGPQSTAKVEVTDQLDACLDFVSADADKGAYDPATGVWTVGALKDGQKATLEIVATVTAACSGTITNTAEVTSSSLPDPSSFFNLFGEAGAEANNSASVDFAANAANLRELDGTTFALGHNYPNPFNPATVVPFSLAEATTVSIQVYDLLGRSVATLVDGPMSAGVHEVRFEASHLPTGMYIVRMEAGSIVKTMRVTLMK